MWLAVGTWWSQFNSIPVEVVEIDTVVIIMNYEVVSEWVEDLTFLRLSSKIRHL